MNYTLQTDKECTKGKMRVQAKNSGKLSWYMTGWLLTSWNLN